MKLFEWSAGLLLCAAPAAAQDAPASRSPITFDELVDAFHEAEHAYQERMSAATDTEEYKKALEEGRIDKLQAILSAVEPVDVEPFVDQALEAASAATPEEACRFHGWIALKAPDGEIATKSLAFLASHPQADGIEPLFETFALATECSAPLGIKLEFLQDLLEAGGTKERRAHVHFARAMLLTYMRAERTEAHEATIKSDEEAVLRLLPDSMLALRVAAPRFERERLQIGMVAPDIEGEDLDGVPFKLSDYRGKVVVLDFWGDW